MLLDILYALLRGKDCSKVGMLRLASTTNQSIVDEHKRCSCGEHRVDKDKGLARKCRGRDALHLHDEATIRTALAVCRNKATLSIVEEVEEALVERKTCTQDGCHNHLIRYLLHGSNAQRRLDHACRVVQLLRYLVSHNLRHTLHITAEAHRVTLHNLIAHLCDKLIENRVLLIEYLYHSFVCYVSIGNY